MVVCIAWRIYIYVGVGPRHVFITEKEDDDFNVECLLVFVACVP